MASIAVDVAYFALTSAVVHDIWLNLLLQAERKVLQYILVGKTERCRGLTIGMFLDAVIIFCIIVLTWALGMEKDLVWLAK